MLSWRWRRRRRIRRRRRGLEGRLEARGERREASWMEDADFDPLRTAEEELRTSTHCRLRKRRWGFRLTADCGGGNGDFDSMRSTEEKFLRLERW